MKSRFFEKFDYLLLICILVLISLGIAFIYSSGVNSEGILVTNEYIKQIIWASIGLVILLLFALFDYKKTERYATWIYLGLIVILIYT
ncbi:MAG: FtsW/RodA/SpoVE family cell cycle protein, partial [Treponema sp.]|nr:FtsW/RodA/SpoVE family cell cycle protein [Treponema sp.]